MRPLPLREKEYRETLYRLERRAIIPLKWCILVITFLLWAVFLGEKSTRGYLIMPMGGWPGLPVLITFIVYAASIVVQTWWFYFHEVRSAFIRPLTLLSYLGDVVFVTLLIYFDLATPYFGHETHNNYYVLYFLLVMRGFALFKTIGETIFVNLLISILFVLMNYLQQPDLDDLLNPEFTQSLVLIWLVILMSWFVIMIINRQKTELMEVHDRLLRAEGLARVGELAAGVAHEINNPIGIIATTAEYLRRYRPSRPEEIEEELAAIATEAMRCKQIIQEMMTYAHPRPIGKVAVDLRTLNDEVLNFVFPRARSHKLEVVRDYALDAPLVEVDPNLLKQALLNLYINARQAVAETVQPRIIARIRPARQGRLLVIEIEDNGPGIAAEDLDHIFDPFFTRKQHGTGLGLAITQRIVEAFDGSIAVDAAPGGGTIFSIELPAVST